MRNNQSKAAMLRNYFDACVLGIKEENYTETDLRNINKIVCSTVSKKTIERDIQITHTGRDNPPGVKDWYEFSKEFPGNEAVFECQRQNGCWNDDLCKRRIYITVVAFVVTTSVYWLVVNLLQVGVLKSVICFIGVVIGLVEQFVENYRYLSISKTADDSIAVLNISRDSAHLEYLQGLINSRRELLVLEINCIHKKNAKKWSEKYEQISNH